MCSESNTFGKPDFLLNTHMSEQRFFNPKAKDLEFLKEWNLNLELAALDQKHLWQWETEKRKLKF